MLTHVWWNRKGLPVQAHDSIVNTGSQILQPPPRCNGATPINRLIGDVDQRTNLSILIRTSEFEYGTTAMDRDSIERPSEDDNGASNTLKPSLKIQTAKKVTITSFLYTHIDRKSKLRLSYNRARFERLAFVGLTRNLQTPFKQFWHCRLHNCSGSTTYIGWVNYLTVSARNSQADKLEQGNSYLVCTFDLIPVGFVTRFSMPLVIWTYRTMCLCSIDRYRKSSDSLRIILTRRARG